MSNSSTSDFLDKLSSLKNDFKVYVPSVKKEVVASPITLKQQKDIISTTVNGVLGALQFTETINNVILDNVEGSDFFAFDRVPVTVDDQTIIFNDLKVLDRVKIVEQLPLELYEKITIFLQETSEFDKYVLSVEDTSITLDATLFDASSTT